MKSIEIYTDGSCIPNPGSGCYAFVILKNGIEFYKKTSEIIKNTTNNRTELLACIHALRWILYNKTDLGNPKHFDKVVLYTDSSYVANGVNNYLAKWLKNNWQTTAKKKVLNIDLWKRMNIVKLIQNLEVQHIPRRKDKYAKEVDDLARSNFVKKTY